MTDPETCTSCGVQVDPRPVTWSMTVDARGVRWLCERCTRENVRGIEGRLDPGWW